MADWKSLVSAHVAKQRRSIPSAWILEEEKLKTLAASGSPREGRLIELQAVRHSGLLSHTELNITESHSASSILQRIQSQELTAEEVTLAFCKRAAVAHQLASLDPV